MKTARRAKLRISIEGAELFRTDIRTRIPFRYGIATMTDVPHVFVRLTVRTPAGAGRGVAADHLPPKWFTKDPEQPVADEIGEMMRVIAHAISAARSISAPSVFRFWQELHETQTAWAKTQGLQPLLANFGSSLVERALIDAFARIHRSTFTEMLRAGRFGVRLGDIHPELGDARPADLLPARPLDRVRCRHTIGLGDPLREGDLRKGESPDDGLPHSLEAGIRSYGLRHFKIKIDGNLPDAAIDRLKAVAAVLFDRVAGGLAVSIDGNESFASAESFRDFWSRAREHAAIERLLRHLLFVEQPLSRAVALHPDRSDFRAWPDRPPIIIDESDAAPDDVRKAVDLGYAGTSHKNCKGIFKGVAHACLIARRSAQAPRQKLILSGEDLCTIGPVALLQDLAVQASLGIGTVERNGHHYFAGLSIWPEEIQREISSHHPDLYTTSERGWPRVAIDDGWISTRSAVAAPLGVQPELRLEAIGCGRTGAFFTTNQS